MAAISDQEVRARFGPECHALLFAWLAREAMRPRRDGDEDVIRRAVWRYGVQRGSRMAQRAQAAGHPLDFLHYLAYSEWRARPEAFEITVLENAPHLHQQVYRCPWHQAWADADLMPYGRLYCLDIDRAVAHGFNPELVLEVNGTHTNGAACCDFVFREAGLTPERQAELDALRVELGDSAVMGWDYHCGHLYQTLRNALIAAYGPEGEAMAEVALAVFYRPFWGQGGVGGGRLRRHRLRSRAGPVAAGRAPVARTQNIAHPGIMLGWAMGLLPLHQAETISCR